MARYALIAALLLIGGTTAGAADLTKIERRLVKEPAYTSGSPRYALLAFGPEAKDRVWIVKDGDTHEAVVSHSRVFHGGDAVAELKENDPARAG